jgi:hypothetical protein
LAGSRSALESIEHRITYRRIGVQDSELIYPYYLSTWRHILVEWLEWSEERFAAWVRTWEHRIRDNERGLGDLFYHEDELHYVLPLLVPDHLGERLAKQRTRRMYNDLAELLYEEIQPAITGRPHHPTWGTEGFDWATAKKRVEAVLQAHGASLPAPDEHGAYERRILGTNVL